MAGALPIVTLALMRVSPGARVAAKPEPELPPVWMVETLAKLEAHVT
jgi:hypothetical protein